MSKKRLKELRKSMGLTLVSASIKIGISSSLLSKMENGVVAISQESAYKLQKFYGEEIEAAKLPYEQKLIDLKKELVVEKEKRLVAEKENECLRDLLMSFD